MPCITHTCVQVRTLGPKGRCPGEVPFMDGEDRLAHVGKRHARGVLGRFREGECLLQGLLRHRQVLQEYGHQPEPRERCGLCVWRSVHTDRDRPRQPITPFGHAGTKVPERRQQSRQPNRCHTIAVQQVG